MPRNKSEAPLGSDQAEQLGPYQFVRPSNWGRIIVNLFFSFLFGELRLLFVAGSSFFFGLCGELRLLLVAGSSRFFFLLHIPRHPLVVGAWPLRPFGTSTGGRSKNYGATFCQENGTIVWVQKVACPFFL